MSSHNEKLEQEIGASGELISYGIARGTEILRYRYPDKSLSGVVFKYERGLLTARHVVEVNRISGFKVSPIEIDIAFKPDALCYGLPLGYVNGNSIKGVDVEMVTASLADPETLVAITGRIGVYFWPTRLRPFFPRDAESATPYLRPGASGSPLIYKDHVIGLICKKPHYLEVAAVSAVVFSGRTMRRDMKKLGLLFEEVS